VESGKTDRSVEYNLARFEIEATKETELAEVRVRFLSSKASSKGTGSTRRVT
jgi:hypothetical protein